MPRCCSTFACSLVILVSTLVFGWRLEAAEGLQPFVNRLMRAKQGTVIVADPRSGRILAVWNPQTAFHEAFPPGSTAKLVVSAAALEEGVITPTDTILCHRVPRLLGDSFHCSHPPAEGPFGLSAALANSCNYFFSEVSLRLSTSALAHWYAAFGFGVAGEDTLPGEVHIRDTARDRVLAALGVQGVTATPAQVLMAYSAVATGGRVFGLIAPAEQRAPWLERVVPLKKTTLAALSQGLRDCVENGICAGAAVPGVSVAGKTGTAAAHEGSRNTHGWFVGYAPADSPEVTVVVFLRRGAGGADAAPLAAEILKRYFAQKGHTR